MASCQSIVDKGKRLRGCMSAFNNRVLMMIVLKEVFNQALII
jgi:hypothetical protein